MWGQQFSAVQPSVARQADHSSRLRHSPHLLHPPIKFPQSQITLQAMPLLAIPNLRLQRREQIKRDIRRLKVLGIRVRHIVG
jgi:hypothetical protein